jgi:hypothetical protein
MFNPRLGGLSSKLPNGARMASRLLFHETICPVCILRMLETAIFLLDGDVLDKLSRFLAGKREPSGLFHSAGCKQLGGRLATRTSLSRGKKAWRGSLNAFSTNSTIYM